MEKNNNLEPEELKKKIKGVPLILKLLQLDKALDGSAPILLFTDQFNETYAAIESEGAQVFNLASTDFQKWLFNFIYESSGHITTDAESKAVLKILQNRASDLDFSLSVRVHKKDGTIYYDLKTSEFIEIDNEGWRAIETKYKLFFRRFKHQKQQVEPTAGGDINNLIKLINLSERKDEILLKVYLVAAFIPDFPHPVLVIQGPQGSAKSTLCRFLKDLMDPSNLETTSLHSDKDIKEFVQTASHHWFLVLDNLSGLSNEISDVISRIVTGGGLSKRILYSVDDDFIYNFKHLIALNGITQVVYKPDLLDRSVMIQLERISEEARVTEDQLWANYRQIKPGVLGAIFDAVSGALREYPTIEVNQLPRMADFVKWGCAIAKALGYTQEEFLLAYAANTKTQNEAAVDANPIASVIVEFMENPKQEVYMDTPANLYGRLSQIAKNLELWDSPGWPKAANALTKKIPEFQPVLQSCGFKITTSKGTKRSVTILRIDKPKDDTDDTLNQPSPSKQLQFSDTKDGKDDKVADIPF